MKDRVSLIMLLRNIDDCMRLEKSNVSHVNINIGRPNIDVIRYLINKGDNYLISDYVDNKYGYIYVTYDKFREGQNIINGIIAGIDKNYNELEKAKYLYVKLAKIVNFDINVMDSKNDIYNFYLVNTINNIWGSISLGKVSNISLVKLYYYLCSLVGIKSSIVSSNGYFINKLEIDGKDLLVDITKDMAFIQAGFRTRYFDSYNDDIELDRNIGYVKGNYSDFWIDRFMRTIDYTNNNFVYNILNGTKDIIDVINMGPQELDVVYSDIFRKYCSNYNVSVNNLYVNNNKKREHFILISYNNHHYSFNYNLNNFVEVDNKDLLDNLANNNIGLYLNEDIVINGYETIENV